MDNYMKVCVECLPEAMNTLSKSATVTHINDYDSADGYQPGTCEQCQCETDEIHRLAITMILI